MESKLSNPGTINKILKDKNFKIKKQLGQNFLVDENILNKIILAADIRPEDHILEIGPGLGTLTTALAEHAKKVVAVEIDSKVLPLLNENLKEFNNFKVLEGDFLKLNMEPIIYEEFNTEDYKVVANLPYYITSPILFKILEFNKKPTTLVVMVQKEVAERIASPPGSRDYGITSVIFQMFAEIELVTVVSRNSFFPKPNVDSGLLKFSWREKPAFEISDKKDFIWIVKAAFSKRRKTLLNSLSGSYLELSKDKVETILEICNIDPQRRAETLTLQEFAALSLEIQKQRM